MNSDLSSIRSLTASPTASSIYRPELAPDLEGRLRAAYLSGLQVIPTLNIPLLLSLLLSALQRLLCRHVDKVSSSIRSALVLAILINVQLGNAEQ